VEFPIWGCPTLVAPFATGWASRHPHVGNCEKKIAAEKLGHPPFRAPLKIFQISFRKVLNTGELLIPVCCDGSQSILK
jgi:hypothetical protein